MKMPKKKVLMNKNKFPRSNMEEASSNMEEDIQADTDFVLQIDAKLGLRLMQ